MKNLQKLSPLLFCIHEMLCFSPPRERYPHVIAHRGSSGYVPEHTLGAYQTAMDLGTDYIEPDLCLTKDGKLVAIHDVLLDDVTNVAEIYPGRNETRNVYGQGLISGFFVANFTYQEILNLTLHQRLSYRTTVYNNYFKIPLFDDIIRLLNKEYTTNNRTIGIYVEIKSPTYHNQLGMYGKKMEDLLLDALKEGGFTLMGAQSNSLWVLADTTNVLPLIIQCFEVDSLKYLRNKTDVPLVQLIEINSSSPSLSPTGQVSELSIDLIHDVSQFADGIGPDKHFFEHLNLEESKSLISLCHSLGMVVHPWTFRADSGILPKFNDSFEAETAYFYECLQVDGLFTEFPDMTRETVNNIIAGQYMYAEECKGTTSSISNSNSECDWTYSDVTVLVTAIVVPFSVLLLLLLLGYFYFHGGFRKSASLASQQQNSNSNF